jgi:hypothetical protein
MLKECHNSAMEYMAWLSSACDALDDNEQFVLRE